MSRSDTLFQRAACHMLVINKAKVLMVKLWSKIELQSPSKVWAANELDTCDKCWVNSLLARESAVLSPIPFKQSEQ